jgi:hypothetical protein
MDIKDLAFTFTLIGYENIKLKPNGDKIDVTL